jgi:hypothetical protein
MLAGKIGYFRASLDAAAAAYIAAVEAADGQALEAGVRTAINDFVVGCKADGIWSAISSACILAGSRTLSGALVPLAGSAPVNSNFVGADYNRKTGLIGDAATKTLRVSVSANAQDDFAMSVWVTQVPSMIDLRCIAGYGTGTNLGTTHIRLRTSSVEFRSRSGGGSSRSGTPPTGLWGHSRSSSSSFVRFIDATSTTAATASSGGSGSNYHIFAARNYADNAASNFSDPRIAWFHFGPAISLPSLSARLSTLITTFGAVIA